MPKRRFDAIAEQDATNELPTRRQPVRSSRNRLRIERPQNRQAPSATHVLLESIADRVRNRRRAQAEDQRGTKRARLETPRDTSEHLYGDTPAQHGVRGTKRHRVRDSNEEELESRAPQRTKRSRRLAAEQQSSSDAGQVDIRVIENANRNAIIRGQRRRLPRNAGGFPTKGGRGPAGAAFYARFDAAQREFEREQRVREAAMRDHEAVQRQTKATKQGSLGRLQEQEAEETEPPNQDTGSRAQGTQHNNSTARAAVFQDASENFRDVGLLTAETLTANSARSLCNDDRNLGGDSLVERHPLAAHNQTSECDDLRSLLNTSEVSLHKVHVALQAAIDRILSSESDDPGEDSETQSCNLASKPRKCIVCMDDKPVEHTVKLACQGKHIWCRTCLLRSFSLMLDLAHTTPPACCDAQIPFSEEIRDLMKDLLFKKESNNALTPDDCQAMLEELYARRAREMLDETCVRCCTCKQTIANFSTDEIPQLKEVRCPDCRISTCILCGSPHHEDEECSEIKGDNDPAECQHKVWRWTAKNETLLNHSKVRECKGCRQVFLWYRRCTGCGIGGYCDDCSAAQTQS